jgi:hypothetical protein
LTLPHAEFTFEDDSDKKAILPQSSGVTKQFPAGNQESCLRGVAPF